jgi:mannose-6-phosphate isomerase-like protein (cupin superfamily)/uncharacterized protein YndB with AHSA1/START domain
MAKPHDVLAIPELGIRVVMRQTADDTAGEMLEIDVIGRPRGFIAMEHVHVRQEERHEVISGTLKLKLDGREHRLGPGQSMVVPPGTRHSQRGGDAGEGHVRIQVRPALDLQAFLERLAHLSRSGDFNRFGYPKLVAGAELVRDFGANGHGAWPPLAVQQALARAVLRLKDASREYVFVDEWDVDAPIDAVHAALADARTYPKWWRPVYIDVDAEGPPALGKVSRQHFKGRLPYHLRTRSTIVRLEPPHVVAGEVEGDLRGYGEWTLTPAGGGTHVRFDWRVHADRRLLRILTPVLRPLLRWNHDWAIARAREGLEPYARQAR